MLGSGLLELGLEPLVFLPHEREAADGHLDRLLRPGKIALQTSHVISWNRGAGRYCRRRDGSRRRRLGRPGRERDALRLQVGVFALQLFDGGLRLPKLAVDPILLVRQLLQARNGVRVGFLG